MTHYDIMNSNAELKQKWENNANKFPPFPIGTAGHVMLMRNQITKIALIKWQLCIWEERMGNFRKTGLVLSP